MPWGSVITGLLKLVAGISEYLSRRQLLEAGKAQIISEGLQSTLDNLEKAEHVKKELSSNPDGKFSGGVRDKYTRSDE
jgi:hypothetical protein